MPLNLIKYFVAFLLLILSACKPPEQQEVSIPDYVIPQDSLVNFLTDAYLGEGASSINVRNAIGEKFDSVYLFNPFKEHHISRQRFDTSIAFYTQHPKKLKIIYDQVLDQLSKLQAKKRMD
jgi:hypothetical protein